MTDAARKVRAKRQRRPIYLVVARACDVPPNTGVLVPLTKWDQRAMRDRKLGVGTEVRAELKKPRNVKHHRLAHALAGMLADSLDEFSGLPVHDILKRLQSESGAACDVVEYDIPNVGKLTRNEPQSLSFDDMDESQFGEVMQTIYRHIKARYWPTMDEEQIALMVEAYERDQ